MNAINCMIIFMGHDCGLAIIVFTRNRKFGSSLHTAGHCQKQLLLTLEEMGYKDKFEN